MPSHLRIQSSFEPFAAHATHHTSSALPPVKKQKMSLTQTYYVASAARSKLGREAGRADHNLRLLVGHANLLDSLMAELQDAERAQEAWFHQSVSKASKPEETRHITWIDQVESETIEEEDEEDDDESDDDSDLDDDAEIFNIDVRPARQPAIELESADLDEEDEEDEEVDAEADGELTLTRSPSRHSPPELMDDSDSEDSEDESMPPSPESDSFELDEKQRQAMASTSFYDAKASQGIEDYIMQSVQPSQAPLIAAY